MEYYYYFLVDLQQLMDSGLSFVVFAIVQSFIRKSRRKYWYIRSAATRFNIGFCVFKAGFSWFLLFLQNQIFQAMIYDCFHGWMRL